MSRMPLVHEIVRLPSLSMSRHDRSKNLHLGITITRPTRPVPGKLASKYMGFDPFGTLNGVFLCWV